MAELSLDEMLNEIESDAKVYDKAKLTPEEDAKLLSDSELYKSDIANAVSARLEPSNEEREQDIVDEILGEEKIYPKPIVNPELVKGQPEEKKPELSLWEKASRFGRFAITGNTAPLHGVFEKRKDKPWEPFVAKGELFLKHEYTKAFVDALGVGEYTVVKGLWHMTDTPRPPEFSDYTYTNYFINVHGMVKDKAKILGFGAAIFGDPITYLSFGAKSGVKLVADVPLKAKGLGISARGYKQVGEIVQKHADATIELARKRKQAAHDAKVAMGEAAPMTVEVTKAERNKIRVKMGREAEVVLFNAARNEQLYKKKIIATPKEFTKDVEKMTKQRTAWEKVKGSTLIGQGDIRFMGRTIVPGEHVYKIIEDSGIPKHIKKVTEKAKETVPGAYIAKGVEASTDFLGKAFVTDYGVPKGLVRALRDSNNPTELVESAVIKNSYKEDEIFGAKVLTEKLNHAENLEDLKVIAARDSEAFFKGLNPQERQDFADTMNWASTQSEKILDDVPETITPKRMTTRGVQWFAAKSKFEDVVSPKVQDRIDRWLAQGKYKGQKSMADEFWDQSVKVGLEPPKKLKYWYPGVVEEADVKSIRFDTPVKPADRDFLKERTGLDPGAYTRDPVKALTYRRVQIAYANLQDAMYEGLKKDANNFTRKDLINHLIKKNPDIIKNNPKLENPANWEEHHFGEQGYLIYKKPKKVHTESVPIEGTKEFKKVVAPVDKDQLVYGPEEMVKQWETVTFKEQFPGKGGTNKAFHFFDQTTGIYKRWVTLLHPAYHMTNMSSNIILNAMRIGGHAIHPKQMYYSALLAFDKDGVLVKTLNKAAKAGDKGAIQDLMGLKEHAYPRRKYNFLHEAFKASHSFVRGQLDAPIKMWGGVESTPRELLEEATRLKVIDGDLLIHDIAGENLRTSTGLAYQQFLTRYGNPLSADFAPMILGRNFATYLEQQSRMVNYMTWRMKGLSPNNAAFQTFEALYNYGDVTQTERIANVIIPFVTFSNKNFRNHVKLMTTTPGAVNAQLKFYKGFAPPDEELREDYPSWVADRISIKVGDNIATNFNAPIEDIIGWLDSEDRPLTLRFNPIIKYAYETMGGRDIWSDRKIEEIDKADEFRGLYELATMDVKEGSYEDKLIRTPAKIAAEFLGLQEKTTKKGKSYMSIDPNKRWLLTQFPTSRFQSNFSYFNKELSTEDMTNLKNSVKYWLGWNVIEPDPELRSGIEFWKTKNKMKAIALENRIANDLRHRGKRPGFVCVTKNRTPADRLSAKLCTVITKRLRNKQSVSYYRDILKEFKEFAVERGKEVVKDEY